MTSYDQFLQAKVAVAPSFGFDLEPCSLNPALILHQPLIVEARVRGGCELSTPYWLDSAAHCAAAERQFSMPDLFAALDAEQTEPADLNAQVTQ